VSFEIVSNIIYFHRECFSTARNTSSLSFLSPLSSVLELKIMLAQNLYLELETSWKQALTSLNKLKSSNLTQESLEVNYCSVD
jgi:hypothetical protein